MKNIDHWTKFIAGMLCRKFYGKTKIKDFYTKFLRLLRKNQNKRFLYKIFPNRNYWLFIIGIKKNIAKSSLENCFLSQYIIHNSRIQIYLFSRSFYCTSIMMKLRLVAKKYDNFNVLLSNILSLLGNNKGYQKCIFTDRQKIYPKNLLFAKSYIKRQK